MYKPRLLDFTNQKLTKYPEERTSTKQFVLDNMRLFEFDPTDKKKRRAQKAAVQEEHPISCVRKQFEETGKQESNIHSRNTGVPIVMDSLTKRSNRRRDLPFNPLS